MWIVIGIIALVIIWALMLSSQEPYTSEEWEEQQKRDFKKYGPVPDDIDE